MSSSNSLIGQQLTHALADGVITTKSSHLAVLSIAGIDNPMAELDKQKQKVTTKRSLDVDLQQPLE